MKRPTARLKKYLRGATYDAATAKLSLKTVCSATCIVFSLPADIDAGVDILKWFRAGIKRLVANWSGVCFPPFVIDASEVL